MQPCIGSNETITVQHNFQLMPEPEVVTIKNLYCTGCGIHMQVNVGSNLTTSVDLANPSLPEILAEVLTGELYDAFLYESQAERVQTAKVVIQKLLEAVKG